MSELAAAGDEAQRRQAQALQGYLGDKTPFELAEFALQQVDPSCNVLGLAPFEAADGTFYPVLSSLGPVHPNLDITLQDGQVVTSYTARSLQARAYYAALWPKGGQHGEAAIYECSTSFDAEPQIGSVPIGELAALAFKYQHTKDKVSEDPTGVLWRDTDGLTIPERIQRPTLLLGEDATASFEMGPSTFNLDGTREATVTVEGSVIVQPPPGSYVRVEPSAIHRSVGQAQPFSRADFSASTIDHIPSDTAGVIIADDRRSVIATRAYDFQEPRTITFSSELTDNSPEMHRAIAATLAFEDITSTFFKANKRLLTENSDRYDSGFHLPIPSFDYSRPLHDAARAIEAYRANLKANQPLAPIVVGSLQVVRFLAERCKAKHTDTLLG